MASFDTLSADDMNTILAEATNGQELSIKTRDGRAFRKLMEKQVADIRSREHIVDVPPEMPGL